MSALQRGVRPSPLSKAHTSPLLLPAQRRLRRRGANIPVAKGPSWTELAITPLPQLAPWSENKNTDVHIAQLQGCMEKGKKKQ